MSKKTLRFDKIQINKMPGLVNGLKPYENLSPHINIIAGPNASGKSSTAKAIQKLLWQNSTERISATGQFEIDGDSWLSEVDPSFARFQKGGSNADMKGIPSEEERSRYMLSLHDLIREEESDLAESILKDAIGGYDIDKAKNNLDYSDSKKTTNTNQYKGLREAKENLYEITEKQKALQADQDRLAGLDEEKTNAKEAIGRADFFKLVQTVKEKQAALTSIRDQLSEFSDKMDRIKEDDYNEFEGLLEEIQDQGKSVKTLKTDIDELTNKKAELNLTENGIESLDLSKADKYLDELDELENVISGAEIEIEKVKAELEQASKKLGLEADDNDFEGLNAETISKTEQFWQRGFDLIGRSRELEKQVDRLKGQQEDTPESEKIVLGVSALSNWLSTYGNPSKPISKFQFGLLLIVVLITAAAVQLFGAFGYLGILLVAIILFLIYKDQDTENDSSVSLEKASFEQTDLNGPTVWQAEEVANRLKELFGELKEAKHQEEVQKQILSRQEELDEVNKDLEAFKEEVEKLKEHISVIPNLDTENLKGYSNIFWHLNNVLDWEEARTSIQVQESVINKTQEKHQKWLDQLNPIFEKYGLDSVSNYADAKASYKELRELREQFNELSGKIEQAESDQKRAQRAKEKAEEKLQKICNRLEVTPEDSFQVKKLVDDLNGYNTLKQKENNANVLLIEAKHKMESNDLFEAEEDEISDLTIDDIATRIEWHKKKAEKLEEINEQITAIETRIEDTKQKHDLEQALQKEEEALLGLVELYKKNTGSIIGDLLVKHLKADLGEKNMPDVFDRAKGLFKRITKNRYELVVDSENEKAEFRAKDLRDGVGRSLNELSTGTRIQLIMSVRLAFIEKAESEIKLPILADELLANSDSERANAIIDALIEISKEGRQIFYFTAQEDEVAKWEYKLKDNQFSDYQLYIIEKTEPKFNSDDDVFTGIQLQKELPAPGSKNYDEYGEALNVQPIGNIFTPVEQLHVWYLMDDTDLLYRVLKQGIENWGMLKSYFKEEGVIDGLGDKSREQIEQRAELIERYLELLQHGQSKKIDRQILEDSGAVTSNKIDEVAELLKMKNDDPEKLIQGLYEGDVSRYQKSKTEELEEYLIHNGYIKKNEPFSPDEIQMKMMAFISTVDITVDEAQTILDRLKKY